MTSRFTPPRQTPSTLESTRSKRSSASSMTASVSAIDVYMREPASVITPFGGVGRAHLLHHVLARLHLLREAQRVLEVEEHHARGLEVDDRALVVGDERQVVLLDDAPEAGGQPVAGHAGQHRRAGPLHLGDGEVAGRAAQRVGAQRAADVGALAALAADAAGEARHDVAAAADAAGHRVAAGDALAEDGEVGAHAEVPLRPAQPEPEPGDDLVEDEQRAELVAQLAHGGVEAERHRPRAALRADRLDDHRRRAAHQLVLLELPAQRVQVVGEELARRRRGAERDALGLEPPGAGHVQAVDHLVAPAVVRAADLDHPLLAGEGARAADGRHHALGAGAEHAEHLAGRHEPAHELRQLELVLVEEAGHGAGLLDDLRDLAAHRLVVAAEHRRAARPAGSRCTRCRPRPRGVRPRPSRSPAGTDS